VIARCVAVIMPLIRCTRKLVAEMRTQFDSAVEQANAALLGDWYANLLQIDRRKCVIGAKAAPETSSAPVWNRLSGPTERDERRRIPRCYTAANGLHRVARE
jgi:Domain of unknown function (DUF6933)